MSAVPPACNMKEDHSTGTELSSTAFAFHSGAHDFTPPPEYEFDFEDALLGIGHNLPSEVTVFKNLQNRKRQRDPLTPPRTDDIGSEQISARYTPETLSPTTPSRNVTTQFHENLTPSETIFSLGNDGDGMSEFFDFRMAASSPWTSQSHLSHSDISGSDVSSDELASTQYSRKRSRVENPKIEEPVFCAPTGLNSELAPTISRAGLAKTSENQQYHLTVDFPKHGCSGDQVKSRVETQIAVRFRLLPWPKGVSKLQLPRHSISKIKYLNDTESEPSVDTLGLQATLVCASAMKEPDMLERALCEARGEPVSEWALERQQKRQKECIETDEKKKVDYSKPLFGASVQICQQCITRERKRASRKKNKKPEEEERWAQDEKKRIIVFNTSQMREWMPVADHLSADTQMRICCYCRHHGERDGFRVIFTLRDYKGAVVAQTISSTILITDDHKNSNSSMYAEAFSQPPSSIGIRVNGAGNSAGKNVGYGCQPFVPTKRRRSTKVPSHLAMTPANDWEQPATSLPDDRYPFTFAWRPESRIAESYSESFGEAFTGNYAVGRIPATFGPIIDMALIQTSSKVVRPPQYTGTPRISRIVPSQGSCAGGIEITVLGADFVDGLTVMFGDTPAPDTMCYSPSTLLCRLPPHERPDTVAVTLKNMECTPHTDGIPVFKYVDDVEKELMALALQVLGMKMKGHTGSREIALSILSEHGFSIDRDPGLLASDIRSELSTEGTLLACLEAMDLDQGLRPALLNHRNKAGQTMLHLGCALGMERFTAALLARGTKPNALDSNGYTALHFAALWKKTDVVRKLLLSGADAGIRTRNGETAADLGESEAIVQATWSIARVRSRSGSASKSRSSSVSPQNIDYDTPPAGPETEKNMLPSTMAAWREQLVEQLSVHFNFDWINAADYNPMAKFNRWNALIPPFPQREACEYKWSELFSPPAYDDLFPAKPAVAEKATSTFDLKDLHRRILRDEPLTVQQREEYKDHMARMRKMRRIKNDRVLYLFWLPALVVIIALMSFSSAPKIWAVVEMTYASVRDFNIAGRLITGFLAA